MEAEMSGDPQKCWERALIYRYLANDARTEPAKQMFFDLSQTWFRLAAELADTNTFRKALSEMEFEDGLEGSVEEADAHEAA